MRECRGAKCPHRGITLFMAALICMVFCGSPARAAGQADLSALLSPRTKRSSEDGAKILEIMRSYNTKDATESNEPYRSFYEVFVYSFFDSDGDGIGDIAGLTQKLDYINDGDAATDTDLGCGGIWLMPVMPSTTYHKYDVTDYCGIDPQYGTLEDFQDFMEEAHARGLRVILDLVMNHTSSQHAWFREACAYLQSLEAGQEPDADACPYIDYYHFTREKSGSSYYPVAGTDWYYEAPFWSEMPDLNLGSEAVRGEFEKIVSFWLDLGVDGFRLDAAKEYYSADTEANIEVLTWFNAMVKEKKPDAYLVAEVWSDLETYAKYYESGIDSCFDFAFADADGVIACSVKHQGNSTASSYGRAIERMQEELAKYSDSCLDAPFYTNHDMGRGAGYYAGAYSENQTKIAQAMNLFMSGSAFLYYGEELGMKGAGKDENKRAPMYWSEDADAPGMCAGPPGMEEIKMKFKSLKEQEEDGGSVFCFVREALRLRGAYPAIAGGTAVFVEELSDENVCVLQKTYGDEQVLLVFNLSDAEQTVDLSEISPAGAGHPEKTDWRVGGVLVTTPEEPVLEKDALRLPLYSVAVLEP